MAVRSLSVGEWSKTDGELSEWVTVRLLSVGEWSKTVAELSEEVL